MPVTVTVAEVGMAKDKNHYVPQFYLRFFGSDRRRINLFNLSRSVAIQGVSIRDQCRRHGFYGETDELENLLMKIESVAGPVLRRICDSKKVPSRGTLEHEVLVSFVALQLLRTAAMARTTNEAFDKLLKKTFRRDPRISGAEDKFKFYSPDAVRVSLHALDDMIHAIGDLKSHLVCCSGTQFFITCDNPVFRYNQYCEGLGGSGALGAACRGLQIFLPLSPSVLIVLYDGWVYKVGRNRPLSDVLPDQDIDALNAMQVVAADENLYFSDWNMADKVKDLFEAHRRHRMSRHVNVNEFIDVKNENSSLLQVYHRSPNLKLRLSLIQFRRAARRVPATNRLGTHRKDMSALLSRRDIHITEGEMERRRLFRRLPNDSALDSDL